MSDSLGRSGEYPNYHISTFNKFGRELKIVNDENFQDVSFYSEGKLGIKQQYKWGFADSNGKVIIDPQFESVSSFTENLCAVRIGDDKNGKWGAINPQGKLVILPKYDRPFLFHKEYAAVSINGKYGIINKNGDFLIEPIFDKFSWLNDDKQAMIIFNGIWSLVNLNF